MVGGVEMLPEAFQVREGLLGHQLPVKRLRARHTEVRRETFSKAYLCRYLWPPPHPCPSSRPRSGCRRQLDKCALDDADMLVNTGCVLFKEGQYEAARQKFNEALSVMGYQVCVEEQRGGDNWGRGGGAEGLTGVGGRGEAVEGEVTKRGWGWDNCKSGPGKKRTPCSHVRQGRGLPHSACVANRLVAMLRATLALAVHV